MPRPAEMDDLFGHVPQASDLPLDGSGREGESFAERHRRWQTEYYGEPVVQYDLPPGGHTADTIRPILLAMIAEARALTTMRWTPRKLRSYTSQVPYMAEWLKGGEGDRLMAEFKAEMDRLGAPADQVAPNWRRIWGLAA